MQKTQELRENLETNSFFKNFGFEVIDFEEDNVLLKLPFNKDLLNLSNTMHGGVHATMLDWVFGMLIRIKTQSRCATLNLNMNYLRPSVSNDLYAKGRIVQEGYRLMTVEGEVFDKESNVLAKGIGTFKIIRG